MPSLNRRAFFTQCAAGSALASTPAAATAAGQPASGAAPPGTPAPAQRMRAMMHGTAVTHMLAAVAHHGIADHLVDGPKPVDALAAAAQVHADTLYRVLRCLASVGVFHEEEGRRFRQNDLSSLLASDAPGSLRVQMRIRGEEFFWRSFGVLRESLRTGRTGFEIAYGQNTFDWFKDHPEEARLFDRGQAEITAAAGPAIAAAYPFGRATRIADIGGGNGTLLRTILERYPGPRAVLFDLPHVVTAARPALAALASRIDFAGGDFFVDVPGGADLYLMKYILHDWEDGRALAILANTRKAMPSGARLLVVEDLVCGPNVPCTAKLGDVAMLARTGGRNMTEEEYRDLLRRGGFTVTRVIPAIGDMHILESRPS